MTALPDGWGALALGDIADIVRGVTYKKSDARSAPAPGYTPLLRATNIGSSIDLAGEMVYVPTGGVNTKQFLRRGDIVLASSSGSLSVVGKNARLLVDWSGTFGAFCAVIRARSEVDSRYLALYLSSDPVRRRWSEAARGTNINNLKKSDLLPTTVPLPPMDEQRRIVDILEDHLSRLDAATMQLKFVPPRVESLRRTLLATRFGPSAFPDLPRIQLERLTQSDRKISYGVLVPGPHVEDGIPLVRISDIRDGSIDVTAMKKIDPAIAAQFPRTRLYGGEVLMSVVGTIGRVAVVPRSLAGANVARAVSMLPFQEKVMLPEFAAYALTSPAAQRALSASAHEVARKTLNLEDVRHFELPVPPISQQAYVVGELETALGDVRYASAAVAAVALRAPYLRAALLAAAFSGRLTGQTSDMEMVEEMAGV